MMFFRLGAQVSRSEIAFAGYVSYRPVGSIAGNAGDGLFLVLKNCL